MKIAKIIICLFMTLNFCLMYGNLDSKKYKVIEVKGKITINDESSTIVKGNIVRDNDVLYSKKESMLKINKDSKALTLRIEGESTVKELIDKVPNKYVNAISNIRSNLKKQRQENPHVYGVVTMNVEHDSIDIHNNEGYVFCKEDSIGNLHVIFFRYGMNEPQMFTLTVSEYVYLLKMAVMTAQGYDYAYNYDTSNIYSILFKPLEAYFKVGDTIIISLPASLSVFELDDLPLNDNLLMKDIFIIYNISDFYEEF